MKVSVRHHTRGVAILAMLCLSAVNANAGGTSTYGFGIEGFQDKFDGTMPQLANSDYEEKTTEGSITGYYGRTWTKFFAALDARASYGTAQFSSSNLGSVSGMPQFEFDIRGRIGKTYSLWGGAISPYTGLGIAYYEDQAKGYNTNLGFGLYDHDITQFYLPVGASFNFTFNSGWSVTPQLEGDLMFYGNADSRFTNTPIPTDVGTFQVVSLNSNTQDFGYGARGELMFGKSMGSYTLQFGPFFRYWSIGGSDKQFYKIGMTSQTQPLNYPGNDRTQIGAALRVLW